MVELPSKCKKVLEDLEERTNAYRDRSGDPIAIDGECLLHIFVLKDYFEENVDKPSSALFGNRELSVYIEGNGFPKLDLRTELSQFRNKTGLDFIGITFLKVSEIKEADFRFVIVHDPYPYKDRSGVLIAQHANHGLIVCNKDPTSTRLQLQNMSNWSLHPYDGAKEHFVEP